MTKNQRVLMVVLATTLSSCAGSTATSVRTSDPARRPAPRTLSAIRLRTILRRTITTRSATIKTTVTGTTTEGNLIDDSVTVVADFPSQAASGFVYGDNLGGLHWWRVADRFWAQTGTEPVEAVMDPADTRWGPEITAPTAFALLSTLMDAADITRTSSGQYSFRPVGSVLRASVIESVDASAPWLGLRLPETRSPQTISGSFIVADGMLVHLEILFKSATAGEGSERFSLNIRDFDQSVPEAPPA